MQQFGTQCLIFTSLTLITAATFQINYPRLVTSKPPTHSSLSPHMNNNNPMQGIKFQNVDPATFLRSFNKLVDYYHTQHSKPKLLNTKGFNQIILQPLSKFPIPSYFQKMQGIYTGVTEKQLEDTDKLKQKFNQLDDRFMNNHRRFMAQTLGKMIEDNRSHIGLIQKSKTFYLLKEARRHNVQDQVRLGSGERREVGGDEEEQGEGINGENGGKLEQRERTRPEMYETDYKVLTTDSYKNPKPIIFRNKDGKQSHTYKLRSAQEVENQLEKRRTSTNFPNVQKPKKDKQQLTVKFDLKRQSRQSTQKHDNSSSHMGSRSSSTPHMKPRASSIGRDLQGIFQRQLDDQDDIFDPQKYIKTRFQDPTVQLKYEYDRTQREASERFKKRLAYHYLNDDKFKPS